MQQRVFVTMLRNLVTWPVVAGAGVSLVFMLHAGRRQQSAVLMLLFGLWVLSPFLSALVGGWVSRRWAVSIRRMVDVMMAIFALVSTAIYGVVAYGNVNVKAGFVFLMVPLASWLFVLLVFGAAALISSRAAHRGN
jgi:hypothetical protein